MNFLLINGSPRINGNSHRILNICVSHLKSQLGIMNLDSNSNFEVVTLAQKDIGYCKGCRACFQKSEEYCPLKDDVISIRHKMMEVDAIIVVSPVYVEDISGTMKNWIDRMAFNCHRPFLNGKPVYLITSSGAGASKHALQTLKHAFAAWGGIITGMDNYSCGALMEQNEIEKRHSEKIDQRINILLKYMKSDKISLYSLIAFYIQKKYWNKKKDSNSLYDYSYWKDHGWLDHTTIYYRTVNSGRMKIVTAKILGCMISTFMI